MTTPSEATPSVQQQVQGNGNHAIGVNHGTAIGSVGQYVEQQTVQAPLRQLSLHQLPNDIADFTGRTKEIAEIAALLRPGVEVDRPAVVISAVAGMAGVGKSALAVHVAHQLAPQFTDVQLYADLRGTDERSLDPADVLLGWLRNFGIDEAQVPAELEQRSQMYRSCLAGKRSIVVLDNARDAAQVRPLLPGSSRECAVIVTSRRRLATLAGAEILDLEVMEPGEALDLLRKLAKVQVEAEPEAAGRLAELCGRLPLALRIAGSLLRLKPHWTVTELVGKLADERRRLEQLQLEDLDVRASFNLSYGELGEAAARLFRFLGLLPRDFAAGVAAALVEWEEEATQEALEQLIDTQLLEPFGVGRFVLHDLMRLVAREHLERREAGEIAAAEGRVVQWYWEGTDVWNDVLHPVQGWQVAQALDETAEGEALERLKSLLRLQALTWFEDERLNVMEAMWQAERLQAWDKVVAFAANLVRFLGLCGYWNDWVETHQLALNAANTANDLKGKARILSNLGTVYLQQGEWEEAINHYKQGLQIKQKLGDQHGAEILVNLGTVYFQQGEWEEAINHYKQGLQVFQKLGDTHKAAQILGNLGAAYFRQDKWEEAINHHEQSLESAQELGYQHGAAKSLNNLGNVYQKQRKWSRAIDYYEQSLQVYRKVGDQHGEGQSLANLGVLHEERKQPQQAIALWQEALTKLHPDSPAFQKVSGWLEEAQNSKPKAQNSPWCWLLGCGCLVFIGFNLLAGHWLLALAVGGLGLGVWGWTKIRN